jgi:hypothetical protein
MREMIEDSQGTPEEGNQRADLFANLIDGTSLHTDEKEDSQLRKEELMGTAELFHDH